SENADARASGQAAGRVDAAGASRATPHAEAGGLSGAGGSPALLPVVARSPDRATCKDPRSPSCRYGLETFGRASDTVRRPCHNERASRLLHGMPSRSIHPQPPHATIHLSPLLEAISCVLPWSLMLFAHRWAEPIPKRVSIVMSAPTIFQRS